MTLPNPNIRAYSRAEFLDAVNLSALIGWLLCTLTACIIDQSAAFLLYAMLFGIPLAFCICWVFVALPLFLAMAAPISRKRAIGLSVKIVTCLAIVYYGATHLAAVGPTEHSVFYIPEGRYYFTTNVDGIRTAQGWRDAAKVVGIAIVLCPLVAVAVQYVIGPGKQK